MLLRISGEYLWRRPLRLGLGLFLGMLLMVACGAAAHVLESSPLAEIDVPNLIAPAPDQSLNGAWDFLPDSEASTALTPASSTLPPLDWSKSQPIAVPANWFREGHDIAGVAWYRHRFTVPERWTGQTITLRFAGVDYAADVWLNGHYLGFHEGYFQTFQFPVGDVLAVDQDNELIVRVNSPLEAMRQDWSLHKRLIKGVLSHHDARPGGAWSDRGQEGNTGGIWAPVTLRASYGLTINQLRVDPQVAADAQNATAVVTLDLSVPSWLKKRPVQFRAQLRPVNFEGAPGPVLATTRTLAAGTNTIKLDIPQANPQLLWTWDHGHPNLYQLRVQILEGDRLLDSQETRFGFRTVAWDDHKRVFRLNGQRLFLRGTNYIPSQWMAELTPGDISRDIDLMQKAHINSVRVHAHVTTAAFYDQADEAGLLIWQDFPLQWGYLDDGDFIAEAVRQGRDMIAQLYNHPAIFTWSLHNEPPWDAFWMEYQYDNYDPNQNLRLDRTLYRELRREDPTRYLHPASVLAEHPWWGWYSFTYGRYGEPTDQPLITEFGAQALPNYASLNRLFKADTLWPDSEADWAEWGYRNFQRKETFEIAQVPMGQNLAEFIENTQDYQARLHQYATEAYRRQHYQPVSAIFQFMFCEPWPSINWGMVDYWRDPKPGYFALQRAYQPVLPSIEAPAEPQVVGESFPIGLWAVNDTWQPLAQATFTYAFLQGDRVLATDNLPFDLAADSVQRLHQLEVTPDLPGEYTLIATIQDQQGHRISRNQYSLPVLPSPS